MTLIRVLHRPLKTLALGLQTLAIASLFMTSPAAAAPTAAPVAAPTYADVADLADHAPMVVDATVRRVAALPPERAATVRPGEVRLFVEADVTSLIRGAGPLAGRISYLVDLPRDARGKPPKLKKARVLLFARPVAGTTGSVQLIARDAQLAWTPELDALTRRILTEMTAPEAPAPITGIASAFHSPGTLPGEGETQIFVRTANSAPASLTVRRSPGTNPRWYVAFGEIVDEAAPPPQRDTLPWFRLACGLPERLPAAALEGQSAASMATARDDYARVRASIGDCPRSRPPLP